MLFKIYSAFAGLTLHDPAFPAPLEFTDISPWSHELQSNVKFIHRVIGYHKELQNDPNFLIRPSKDQYRRIMAKMPNFVWQRPSFEDFQERGLIGTLLMACSGFRPETVFQNHGIHWNVVVMKPEWNVGLTIYDRLRIDPPQLELDSKPLSQFQDEIDGITCLEAMCYS